MNRKLAIAAAVIAAFAFTTQAASAHGLFHKHKHKRLTAVAIGVGTASGVGYLAINNWKWRSWSNASGLTRLGAWGLTTMGCAAVSPMVGTVVLNRPLTMREAHYLIASCVLPVVGGWLVDAAWDAHPEWAPAAPAAPMKKRHHAKK
jgi:hypothetical protein